LPALFGWHGLLIQHPDDWAPVALTGDRKSGYVRLASPRTLSLQVRWAPAGRDTLDKALGAYLDRLSRDARRKKAKFSREIDAEEGRLRYRYRGEFDGEGLLFPTQDGRVAFVEAVGESSTARRRVIERVMDSFEAGVERWSLLGLDFTLPGPLQVERKELLSGRTALVLVGKGVRVTAERWGLAESLLARMSLEEWAAGRLGKGWTFAPEGLGLRGSRRVPFQRDECLLVHQPDDNQLILIRAQTRHEAWRPRWDWLT
jgi:hypothetical protein